MNYLQLIILMLSGAISIIAMILSAKDFIYQKPETNTNIRKNEKSPKYILGKPNWAEKRIIVGNEMSDGGLKDKAKATDSSTTKVLFETDTTTSTL